MNNKKRFVKEISNFSSNVQTDSTSRISYSEIKNIKLLKYSFRAKNIKNSRNNLKIPKLYLKKNKTDINSSNNDNKNFLYSFSRTKRISRNFYRENYTNYTINELNTKSTESKINYSNKYIKIKEPFYKIYPIRKESLIDFNSQSRNIRLLKIYSYNGRRALNNIKESIKYKEAQTMQFEYSRNKEKKLINLYNENLHLYLTFLKKKSIRETIINENLIDKKAMLINKMISMGNKMNKLLKRFEYYLECKSFLLCIKERTIDFKHFSKQSQLDILYDLFKLCYYQNYHYKENYLDNPQLIKNWLISIRKKIYGNSLKKSMYFNDILTSIDMNNFFEIYNCIDNNYIKNHKIKNIFESVKEFDNVLLNLQSHIVLSLDNFMISNEKMIELKNELNEEERRKEKIIEKFNLTKNKYNLLSEKLNIVKTNYIDNIFDNKNYIKNKNNIPKNYNKIDDKLNIIITEIINYDSTDIKKIKFEKTNKKVVTIIDKIRYIEKVMNFLIKYKEEQEYLNEESYQKVMKIIKKEQVIRKFRNKEETMKKIRELKIKKIMEKKDKILFLFHKK
jgi:hypothetical protein